MSKIENLDELRAQIAVLKEKVVVQEYQVRKDIQTLRDDLKPSNIAWSMLSSLTGIKLNQGNSLRAGIFNGVSSIIQRFALKAEKELESRVYKAVDTIFERLSNFVNGFAGHEAKRDERKDHHDASSNTEYTK